ncbi:MAG: hypothetical protein CME70_03245 [Halobacteriovorax sp.]|nr:hypothetical protein [Halobacteriovorax sp.]MBK22999.1 hypothetical protein [Halobacteriovorax sp.]|tara:strand:- start:68652 stop:69395 length:744 start_codon:yes stop_codon:yes gene_type:complete
MSIDIEITQRDFELFKMLNRLKFLRVDLVNGFFFSGKRTTSKRRCQQRLKLLTDNDYLIRVKGGLSTQFIYRLSRKGVRYLENEWYRFHPNQSDGESKKKFKAFPFIESMPWSSFFHEHEVARVLNEFWHGKFRAFYSDRELKRMYKDYAIIPDLLIKTTKGNIAVEVELESKTHKRIREKLKTYSEIEGISYVLYLCNGIGIQQAVGGIAHQIGTLNFGLQVMQLDGFHREPQVVFNQIKTTLKGS